MSTKFSNARNFRRFRYLRRRAHHLFIRAALSILFAAQVLTHASRAQMPLSATPLNPARGSNTATTREGRRAIFEDVWTTIAGRYYDPQLHGLDWQNIGAQFRFVAADASDEQEFYAVIRRMIDALDDSHTRIYSRAEKFDWAHPKLVSAGFNVREIGGEIVIAKVLRASQAEHGGMRAGDVVTHIDGTDVREILARRAREEIFHSTGDANIQTGNANDENRLTKNGEKLLTYTYQRRRTIARLFRGAPDSSLTVTFSSNDKRHTRTLKLKRTLIELETKANVTFFDKRKQFALVEFKLFTPDTAAELAHLFRGDLKSARGIILDLRVNGGGDAEAMTDIASIFLPAGTRLGTFTDRNGRVTSEPQTRAKFLYAADDLKSFHGALIILTGERTASAAEIFVAAMRDAKRAVIIGESTCGCVLGVQRHYVLQDGGALDISEMDYRTARGVRLENLGVIPDAIITPTRSDFITHHDIALERALTELKIKNWESYE